MKTLTLGLIIAALSVGCTGNSSTDTQYFNPNPQTTQSSNQTQVNYSDISYDELVMLVKQTGGRLELTVNTVDVGRDKESPFVSSRGFGYAWANEMEGTLKHYEQNVYVSLSILDVKRNKESPWMSKRGFGYAWENILGGNIGGNTFELIATKVAKRKESPRISSRGFGYAHTQEMYGSIGNKLNVSLFTSAVNNNKEAPLVSSRGFGYSHIAKARLVLNYR